VQDGSLPPPLRALAGLSPLNRAFGALVASEFGGVDGVYYLDAPAISPAVRYPPGGAFYPGSEVVELFGFRGRAWPRDAAALLGLAAAGLAAAALALRPPRPARFEAPPAAA